MLNNNIEVILENRFTIIGLTRIFFVLMNYIGECHLVATKFFISFRKLLQISLTNILMAFLFQLTKQNL